MDTNVNYLKNIQKHAIMETNKKDTKPVLTKKQKRARHGRRFLRVFITISALIILLHIFAPMILLAVINKEMANMKEYTGHINALQFNLFTGQVTVKEFTMKKKGGKIPVPFVDVDRLWVGIDMKAVWHKRIVAKIEVDNFQLNFVKGPTKETSQTSVDKSWIDYFDKLIPIDINILKVNDGNIHYRDFHSNPRVDVYLDKFYVVGENLSTVKDTTKALPASLKVTANAYGGSLDVNSKVNIFQQGIPDFDVNAELKNLPLTYINNFLRAYAKLDVQKGTFSVYSEAACKDGLLKGYVKPLVKDLDVIDTRERKGMPLKDQIIESLVEVVAWIFENKKTKNVATKVEFSGRINKPYISIWGIIGETLINAFIEALMPTLENSININTVGTEDDKNFLEKIFDPNGKHKKNKEERKKKRDQKKKERNKATSGV
jgi:hypothetical protein